MIPSHVFSLLFPLVQWEQPRCFKLSIRIREPWDFPGGPMVKTSQSKPGGPSSILGQGTRSHVPQLTPSTAKRVPEKHLFLLYWLCQSLWLCGSQYRGLPHLWGNCPWEKISRNRFAKAGKCCSHEVRQANLLQSKRGLTVPGGAGCQSVWNLTVALLASAPPLPVHPS